MRIWYVAHGHRIDHEWISKRLTFKKLFYKRLYKASTLRMFGQKCAKLEFLYTVYSHWSIELIKITHIIGLYSHYNQDNWQTNSSMPKYTKTASHNLYKLYSIIYCVYIGYYHLTFKEKTQFDISFRRNDGFPGG